MIDQIEITNFQSHKHSHFSLSDKLNIIKGRTHSGKSCIVRALKWAVENRPKGGGDKFRNDQSKKNSTVSVSLSFSDGSFISREKTSKRNSYITSEHKEPFDAIKLDVPEEVRDVMKLKPHNIRSQGDGYFLIDKTGGQVATSLNNVVGLKIIDDVKAKAKKLVSSFSNRLQVLNTQVEEIESELGSESFASARKIGSLISQYDYEDTIYSTIVDEVEEIESILSEIKESREVIDLYDAYKGLSGKTDRLNNELQYLSNAESDTRYIYDVKEAISEHRLNLEIYNKILPIIPKLDSLKDDISMLYEIEQTAFKVEKVYLDIRNKKSFVAEAADSLESYEDRLIELGLELEKRIDYCDKCGAHKKHWNKKEVRDA